MDTKGGEAIMRKEGERLVMELAPPSSLLAVLATLTPLAEDGYFPPLSDLPPEPVDLWWATCWNTRSSPISSANSRPAKAGLGFIGGALTRHLPSAKSASGRAGLLSAAPNG